jgi:predicted RNA-binding Zn ribbon-like protein
MARVQRSNPSIELSLDFSNTVDWRNGAKKEDTLKSFEELVDWSVKQGVVAPGEASTIRRKAKEDRAEDSTFRRAIQLRETIYRIFSAVAHDEHPDGEDLGDLNRFLSDYPVSSSIVRSGEEYSWTTVPGKGAEGRMLWPIAKSAADLLTSDQLGRVTECANEEEGCGWVFLDKTRSGTKKWCSSTGCGNRAKVRAWYERHEKAEA